MAAADRDRTNQRRDGWPPHAHLPAPLACRLHRTACRATAAANRRSVAWIECTAQRSAQEREQAEWGARGAQRRCWRWPCCCQGRSRQRRSGAWTPRWPPATSPRPTASSRAWTARRPSRSPRWDTDGCWVRYDGLQPAAAASRAAAAAAAAAARALAGGGPHAPASCPLVLLINALR